MKNQIGNYIHHTIYLTPSQIKSFGKSYIVPQDYKNINKIKLHLFLKNAIEENKPKPKKKK